MKTTLREFREIVRAEVKRVLGESALWNPADGIPPWRIMQQLVVRACNGDDTALAAVAAAVENIGYDMGELFNQDLVLQYIHDARRPDSDDQKEGMGTGDYADLALEELRQVYEAVLGLD